MLYVFALLIISISVCVAYADDSSYVVWSKNHKLTWNDFKGTPHTYPKEYKRSSYDDTAFTWGYPRLDYFHPVKTNSNICQYQINNITATGLFDKNQSWATDEARSNPATLIHEQGHFNIIQIYAQKIESDLLYKVMECPNGKYNTTSIDSEIRQMAHDIGVNAQKMHDRYDDELRKKITTQQDWNMKIELELTKFTQFYPAPGNTIPKMTTTVGSESSTCKFGWTIMKKNSDHSLTCVTPAASSVLEARGWGKVWEYQHDLDRQENH